MRKGVKLFAVKVTGWAHAGDVNAALADMLRYDDGKLISHCLTDGRNKFTAMIQCERYTKARWDSFDLATEIIVAGN